MDKDIARVKISLGQLSVEVEGPLAFVQSELCWIKEKMPLSLEQAIVIPSGEQGIKPLAEMKMPETEIKKPSMAVPPLRDFFNEKSPKSHLEKVTTFAYYLKTYKDTLEVSEEEIRPLYNEVGVRKPKHIGQALTDAKNKFGWLASGSKPKYYSITDAGDNLVKLDLPQKSQAIIKK